MANRYWTLTGSWPRVHQLQRARSPSCRPTWTAGRTPATSSSSSTPAARGSPLIAGTRTATSTQATGHHGASATSRRASWRRARSTTSSSRAPGSRDRRVGRSTSTVTARRRGRQHGHRLHGHDHLLEHRRLRRLLALDVHRSWPPTTAPRRSSAAPRSTPPGPRPSASTGSSKTGTSGTIVVSAGAFDRLLVLVPGETAAPGLPHRPRRARRRPRPPARPFTVTVRAVDTQWNPVSSTDTVAITSSDAAAVLPADAALVGGSRTFTVTLETGGPTTVTATDVTDGTKTAGHERRDRRHEHGAHRDGRRLLDGPGPHAGRRRGGRPGQRQRPAGPADHGRRRRAPSAGRRTVLLTLNADGSFTYTPDAGYSGSDTFTYRATDGFLTSTTATVTITITSSAYTSSSGWATSFNPSRYIAVDFPAYVAAGSVVAGATFTHTYRSATSGDTTCYYFEVYQGATLIGDARQPRLAGLVQRDVVVGDRRRPAARGQHRRRARTTSGSSCTCATRAAADRSTA